MCVRAPYAAVVVHVDVVQPAEVLVGLQEAGQLLVLSGRLGQQLPPLPLLHVPAEQEVSKVLQQEVTRRARERRRWRKLIFRGQTVQKETNNSTFCFLKLIKMTFFLFYFEIKTPPCGKHCGIL